MLEKECVNLDTSRHSTRWSGCSDAGESYLLCDFSLFFVESGYARCLAETLFDARKSIPTPN